VVTDYYGTASVMAFYLRENKDIYVYGPGKRMNQFNLWAEEYYPMVQHAKAVYLSHENTHTKPPEGVVLDTTKLRLQMDPKNHATYDVVLYEKFEAPLYDHNGF
jgi:hypothetical protein